MPSPTPQRIVETRLIRQLLDGGAIVVCAGGGVIRDHHGELEGVEAVIDKDATASLLAEALEADLLLLCTDVSTVEIDHGTTQARPISRGTPAFLRNLSFPPGGDVEASLAGGAGTIVTPSGTYP